MVKRLVRLCLSAATAGLCAVGAHAQVQQTLVESPIPFDYSRGRNISVLQRDRPELRALGYQIASFTAFPELDLGVGWNDNVYTTRTDKVEDAYFKIDPSLILRSDWTRHALTLRGNGDFVRFGEQTLRNQNGYNASGSGRIDVGARSSINLDGGTGRLYESRFSGATPDNVASSIPYQRTFGSVRGTYVGGSFRFIAVGDIYDYNFRSIRLLDDQEIGQHYRDRTIGRFTGQAEYSFTDTTAGFIQGGYTDTKYNEPLQSGLDNRSSHSYRVIAGVSFDFTALLRGSIGVGYIHRNYLSPIYKDTGGLSFEGQIEYFLSPITTVTGTARRLVEDSSFGPSSGGLIVSGGYINSGGSLRVDHELLRYVLLYATADYEHDTYQGIDSSTKIIRATGGGRYTFSRSVALSAEASYGQRHYYGLANGPYFNETRGLLTLSLQR